MSFINDAVDILKVLKIRIERGDKITDAVSFRNLYLNDFFVKRNIFQNTFTIVSLLL